MLLSLGQSTAANSARTDEELSFLHAVEFNDVSSVRMLLRENPALNVDVIDVLGRSALRLAIRNENRELVELLLGLCNNENTQQAALQAISENHTPIAELILKHPKYLQICRRRKYLGDVDGFFKKEVESQFSTDITPLNLAAQKNNFTIVQLLLQRGESITKANFRLNAYRGLASEAYISLSSDDPILTAFDLAKELRNLAREEKHFKKEYKDLANRLSGFSVELLDRVWTQQELTIVLNKKGSPKSDKYENLARLKLALDNKEKKFVAHPLVQQHLVRIWHQGLKQYDSMSSLGRVGLLVGLSVIYPVLATGHIIWPRWNWTRLARQSLVKFLGHTMSYLLFLILIILFSWAEKASNKFTLKTHYPNISQEYQKYRNMLGQETVPYGEDFPLRPHEPSVTGCLLTMWIVGMVVQEIQQVNNAGVKAHFNDLFNIVELLLLVMYIAVTVLIYWTWNMFPPKLKNQY